jgi:hypothetical protein
MFFFLCLPLLHSQYSKVLATVIINELYPKPSDEQSEWIELYNTGNESVSLNLWKLENTEGEKKSFIINASAIIQPKGFLLFPKSQTGITMRNDGDTIRLLDQNNTTIDSQNFQGILGYNTSIGRTIDGAGVWTTCTTATQETKNSCPEPTATPSPIISETPTTTVTPIPTAVPDVILEDSPTPIIEVVVVTHIPTPTPTSTEIITLAIPKTIGAQVLIVAVSWAIIALFAIWNTAKRRHKKKLTHHTQSESQKE